MTCPCPQKPPPIRFSAVVLAGGRSRRMGRDKAWLPCEGRPLIERQVALLRSLKPDAVYVSGRSGSDYSSLSCPVLVDRFRDCGPLGGIEAAFAAMPSPMLLVLAVDMPAMTRGCLHSLTAHTAEAAGVVPRVGARLEPLAAFYPKAAHRIAIVLLEHGVLAVSSFAEMCVGRKLARFVSVPPQEAWRFENWNSPADLPGRAAKRSRLRASP